MIYGKLKKIYILIVKAAFIYQMHKLMMKQKKISNNNVLDGMGQQLLIPDFQQMSERRHKSYNV